MQLVGTAYNVNSNIRAQRLFVTDWGIYVYNTGEPRGSSSKNLNIDAATLRNIHISIPTTIWDVLKTKKKRVVAAELTYPYHPYTG